MIRKKLEKNVGPVTDAEWKRACMIATYDIRANRMVFQQKTSHQYLGEILVTAINLIRRNYNSPAANN
jgi:hypothetical protein